MTSRNDIVFLCDAAMTGVRGERLTTFMSHQVCCELDPKINAACPAIVPAADLCIGYIADLLAYELPALLSI